MMKTTLQNWLKGAASAVELFPNTSDRMREKFLERSDAEALYGDWQQVGKDLEEAMGKYGHEKDKPAE